MTTPTPTKKDRYQQHLRTLPVSAWDVYLMAESGLPGPRGNLELAQAVADEGDERLFLRYVEISPREAPVNSPLEFLSVCGAIGLGRLLSEGRLDLLPLLRRAASDPRWRMREGVAMALQRFGKQDMPALLAEMRTWSQGTPFEQRAAVAALCEPALLRHPAQIRQVLDLLDEVTASVEKATDRKSEGFQALRKTLGYGWSVAAAADPAQGLPHLERWLTCTDKDIRWILRENLKKDRLRRADAGWVQRALSGKINPL